MAIISNFLVRPAVPLSAIASIHSRLRAPIKKMCIHLSAYTLSSQSSFGNTEPGSTSSQVVQPSSAEAASHLIHWGSCVYSVRKG